MSKKENAMINFLFTNLRSFFSFSILWLPAFQLDILSACLVCLMVNTAQMPTKHIIFSTVSLPSNYIFENIDATILHLSLHKRYLDIWKSGQRDMKHNIRWYLLLRLKFISYSNLSRVRGRGIFADLRLKVSSDAGGLSRWSAVVSQLFAIAFSRLTS